jgi:NAD(P) transhydrogenase subunit beta
VALITWVEFRNHGGALPFDEGLFEYFAAIIGAISFWGSNIAFGKLQEILPSRPIQLPRQIVFNTVFIAGAVALWVWLLTGQRAEWAFILMLVAASVAGCLLVLPIGGADMPVVISGLTRSPVSRQPVPASRSATPRSSWRGPWSGHPARS